jgi:alkylation response protein AidB-like acyl-CoA dehydrogenase
MATFEASRPAVGAQAVGIARATYEYALDYAGGHRDAKIFTIFEGTSEIQRLTIARAISSVRAK